MRTRLLGLDYVENSADIIVANILADVIIRFTSDVARILKPNGKYITSGIIQAKADIVRENLEEHGFVIEETLQVEDWIAYIAKKA